MADTKPFLSQTAETASFAFREFFRPLVLVAHFLQARLAPAKPAASTAQDPDSLEVAKAFLRRRQVLRSLPVKEILTLLSAEQIEQLRDQLSADRSVLPRKPRRQK